MNNGYGERSPERVRARELATRDAAERVEQDSPDAPEQPSDEVGADAGEEVGEEVGCLALDEPFDAAAYAASIRDRARRRVRPDVLNLNDPLAQALMGGRLGEQGLDTLRAKHARVWRLTGRPVGQAWQEPR